MWLTVFTEPRRSAVPSYCTAFFFFGCCKCSTTHCHLKLLFFFLNLFANCPEIAVGGWTLVALEITWKVTECSFCPKKVALDMECHMQLFLPHHRTCYKDSPTWVEIMPPIPASKHILSCAIVQRGHTGGGKKKAQVLFRCALSRSCLSKELQRCGNDRFLHPVFLSVKTNWDSRRLLSHPITNKRSVLWKGQKCAMFSLHILTALMLCKPPHPHGPTQWQDHSLLRWEWR